MCVCVCVSVCACVPVCYVCVCMCTLSCVHLMDRHPYTTAGIDCNSFVTDQHRMGLPTTTTNTTTATCRYRWCINCCTTTRSACDNNGV